MSQPVDLGVEQRMLDEDEQPPKRRLFGFLTPHALQIPTEEEKKITERIGEGVLP